MSGHTHTYAHLCTPRLTRQSIHAHTRTHAGTRVFTATPEGSPAFLMLHSASQMRKQRPKTDSGSPEGPSFLPSQPVAVPSSPTAPGTFKKNAPVPLLPHPALLLSWGGGGGVICASLPPLAGHWDKHTPSLGVPRLLTLCPLRHTCTLHPLGPEWLPARTGCGVARLAVVPVRRARESTRCLLQGRAPGSLRAR